MDFSKVTMVGTRTLTILYRIGYWAILIAFALVLLLYFLLVILVRYDSLTVSQPRDGLRQWAPEYAQVYDVVLTVYSPYCEGECSDEQLEPFLKARTLALRDDWPDVVDKLSARWRWRKAEVDGVWGYELRDDFFRLMAEVGGPEALKQCAPTVSWGFVSRIRLTESFKGVRCNGKEYMLRY